MTSIIDDIKFKHPFTCMVSGMTSSGKTVLVRRILSNWKNLINIKKSNIKILWCYGVAQNLYNKEVPNVDIIYHNGIPNKEYLSDLKPDIIILDDLMDELINDKRLTQLFTKESHHKNISVIFIVQNLLPQGRQSRTTRLNTHYTIVMKGILANQQVKYYAQQNFPGQSEKVLKIFKQATNKPYGYLIFDFHPNSCDKYRLRSRITKEELPQNIAKIIVSRLYIGNYNFLEMKIKNKNVGSETLRKSMPFLKTLVNLTPPSRKMILKDKNVGGDKALFDVIHEIALNTIKGNVKLDKNQLKKLKPHNHLLNKYCCSKIKKSKFKRQKLIEQSGGFLPILIPAIAALIGSLIKNE